MRVKFLQIDEENTEAIIRDFTPEEYGKIATIVAALYNNYNFSKDEISFKYGSIYLPKEDTELDITEFRKVVKILQELGAEVDYDLNCSDEELNRERVQTSYLHDCFIEFLYELDDIKYECKCKIPYGIQIERGDKVIIKINYQNFHPALIDRIYDILSMAFVEDVMGALPKANEIKPCKIKKVCEILADIGFDFEKEEDKVIWYTPISELKFEITDSFITIEVDKDEYCTSVVDELADILKRVLMHVYNC